MILKSKKYIISVIAFWAIAVVGLTLYNAFAVRTRAIIAGNLEKEFNEKSERLNNATKCGEEAKKISMREQLQSWRDRFDDFVIDADRAAELIFDISRIAKDVKVEEFVYQQNASQRSSPIAGCNNITEGRLNVTFAASFGQFATFINMLERHRPVIFVDKFTISRSNTGKSKHKVQLALTFFVRKQNGKSSAELTHLKHNIFEAVLSQTAFHSKVYNAG